MDTVEDLQKRIVLLKEIVSLNEKIVEQGLSIPCEEDMAEAANYLETLKELQDYEQPDEDEMVAAFGHLQTLEAIEEHKLPSDDEIEKAAQHLATLNEIEERPH